MTDLERRLCERLRKDLSLPMLSQTKVEAAVRGMLEEMRSPDHEMWIAGARRLIQNDGAGDRQDHAIFAWRAMIDAALSPQEDN